MGGARLVGLGARRLGRREKAPLLALGTALLGPVGALLILEFVTVDAKLPWQVLGAIVAFAGVALKVGSSPACNQS